MRVTIDTNVVRDMLDPDRANHYVARSLLRLHEAGEVIIQLTTRITSDVPDGPLRGEVETLPVLQSPRAPAFWRVDHSAVDSGDYVADDAEAAEADRILALLFPGSSPTGRHHHQRCADVDHLMAHRRSGADVFLTWEHAILNQRVKLRDQHRIVVAAPDAFVAEALTRRSI